MKTKLLPSLVDKLNEVLDECSDDTKRLVIFSKAMASPPEDPEMLDLTIQTVLGITREQLETCRAEFNEKLVAWNKTRGV